LTGPAKISAEIERRRLYDIINILESLGIIYRVSKNSFMWKGVDKIRKNLEKVPLLQTKNSSFAPILPPSMTAVKPLIKFWRTSSSMS
jgi:hypothetical protein